MQGDRFIPDRSAMDFDMAYYLLTETKKEKENAAAVASPSKEAYRRHLAETLLPNRTRILAFKAKPPSSSSAQDMISSDQALCNQQSKPSRQRRYIPQSAERTLDAPDIVDDYYLNLLDWGSSNVLAIALGPTVYLWDAADGSTAELTTAEDDAGPVTSVSWAPDGRHLALGLNNSEVQLWDTTSNRLVSRGDPPSSSFAFFLRPASSSSASPSSPPSSASSSSIPSLTGYDAICGS